MFAPIAAVVIAVASLTTTSSTAWVCSTLDSNPTENGVWELLYTAAQHGYATEKDGESLVIEVATNCPEYLPVLKKWADHN